MPRRAGLWCFVGLLAVMTAPARAGITISIGGASINQGSTGSIDVLLTSDATLMAGDQLNNYGFTLRISGPHELQFSPIQSFAYLSSSQYVFAGDSTAQMTGSAGGVVTQTVYPRDTFVGSDSTFSASPVSLSSANTPVLLAELSLDATITSPGDRYTISLIPAQGDGSLNTNAQTYFDVFDFLNTGMETSSVAFSSTSGTVTILGSAVPEPSSIVPGVVAVFLVAGTLRVRRRGRVRA
jgi:hypothetical protein